MDNIFCYTGLYQRHKFYFIGLVNLLNLKLLFSCFTVKLVSWV